MDSRTFAKTLALAIAAPALLAQSPPLTVVTIDVENIVEYEGDVPDVSKLAATGIRTAGASSNNFYPVLWVADVVAVNGKPAKGTWTVRGNQLFRGPNQTPGRAISDSSGAYFFDWVFDLMQADGTPVGSLMAVGTGGAPKPPGAPALILQANLAVTGGTGAFLGVRGQAGQGGNTVGPRTASMSEDPALRRVLGGGITSLCVSPHSHVPAGSGSNGQWPSRSPRQRLHDGHFGKPGAFRRNPQPLCHRSGPDQTGRGSRNALPSGPIATGQLACRGGSEWQLRRSSLRGRLSWRCRPVSGELSGSRGRIFRYWNNSRNLGLYTRL